MASRLATKLSSPDHERSTSVRRDSQRTARGVPSERRVCALAPRICRRFSMMASRLATGKDDVPVPRAWLGDAEHADPPGGAVVPQHQAELAMPAAWASRHGSAPAPRRSCSPARQPRPSRAGSRKRGAPPRKAVIAIPRPRGLCRRPFSPHPGGGASPRREDDARTSRATRTCLRRHADSPDRQFHSRPVPSMVWVPVTATRPRGRRMRPGFRSRPGGDAKAGSSSERTTATVVQGTEE